MTAAEARALIPQPKPGATPLEQIYFYIDQAARAGYGRVKVAAMFPYDPILQLEEDGFSVNPGPHYWEISW